MTIRYFPYAAGAGANVDEQEWSAMARWFREDGVIPGSLNEFEVYGDSSGLQVKVKSGTAILAGGFIDSDAEVIKAVTTADVTNPRIDRVILKIDWTNNTTTIEMLDGTPAASPSPPALTKSTTVWEISLAQVYVGASVSTIGANDVTDERDYSLTGTASAQMGPRQSVTIASGAITVEAQRGLGFYVVTGEGSTDDTLTNIVTSTVKDGMIVMLRKGTGIITITETGNINLDELDQIVLRNSSSMALFMYDATAGDWHLIGGSNYGGKKSFVIPALGFYALDQANTPIEVINTNHVVMTFIDGAVDYGVVNFEMPDDYDGGALDIYFHWIAGVTGTNSVVWQSQVDVLSDGEAFASFDSTDTVTDAAQTSTTKVLRTGSMTVTPTSWAKGDLLLLRIGRLGTNGSDTLAGDAHFLSAKVVYNTTKMNQN